MFRKPSRDRLLKKLKSYRYSQTTMESVLPIILELHIGNISEAERGIALLASRVCSEIRQGSLSPQQGDDCFSLIDIYLDDYYPRLSLKREVKDILFEGMILYDFGNPYGGELSKMETLAKRVIEEGLQEPSAR